MEWEIRPGRGWNGSLSELYGFRYLVKSLVRKDLVLNYQQTLLGPIWILLQPVLTMFVYLVVFGRIIGIPSAAGVPPVLFYFSGIILWNYFSDTLLTGSSTFRDHVHLFSKVYFPRIIMPLTVMLTQLFRLGVQLLLLIILIIYYMVTSRFDLPMEPERFLFIPAILLVSMISFSTGLLFSLATARYRDLMNFLHVGIRLLMFLTPVLFTASLVPSSYEWLLSVNPLTPAFEMFRIAFLDSGEVGWELVYSTGFATVLLIISLYSFNRFGPKLIDIV